MSEDELASQDTTPEEATATARIAELEALLRRRDESLAAMSARLGELTQAAEATETHLAETTARLNEAVTGYRQLITEANPEVPDDLISGESIEAINQALTQGRNLVSRVKQGLEAEVQATRIPTGAPPRTAPISRRSPRARKYSTQSGGNETWL